MPKLITPALLIAAHANAQSEIRELLDAPTVHNYAVFKLDNTGGKKDIQYTVDSYKEEFRDKMDDNKLTLLVLGRKKGINFITKFLNPLQYTISFKDSSMVDPALKDISTFMESVASLTQTLGTSVAGDIPVGTMMAKKNDKSLTSNQLSFKALQERLQSNQKKVEDLKRTPAKKAGLTKSLTAKISADETEIIQLTQNIQPAKDRSELQALTDQVYAPALIGWKYHLLVQVDIDNSSSFTSITPLIKALKACTDIYYGAPKEKATAFNTTVNEALNELIGATDVASFYTAYEGLGAANKQLDAMNTEAEDLEKILEVAIKQLNADGQSVTMAAFIDYTKEALATVSGDMKAMQAKRVELANALKKLEASLAVVLPEKGGTIYKHNGLNIGYSTGEMEKIHVATVGIEYHDPSIKDNVLTFKPDANKSTSFQVRIRRYSPVVVELSGGLFYSNLSFEQYATTNENGVAKVKRIDDSKAPVVAATALNLIINSVNLALAHPLIQIGVGSGKNLPSLMFGTGFKINGTKTICITGGAIWAWQKRPQSFLPGSTVPGDAELKNDLKFEFESKPKMYIGIQYDL